MVAAYHRLRRIYCRAIYAIFRANENVVRCDNAIENFLTSHFKMRFNFHSVVK